MGVDLRRRSVGLSMETNKLACDSCGNETKEGEVMKQLC